jgi:hypothetical protein
MTTITIKNIPPALYERIKVKAKLNRRSINNEIITMLEQAAQVRTPAETQDVLEKTRRLREAAAGYVLTDDEINRWKREGRE